jgi:hypothetical protein
MKTKSLFCLFLLVLAVKTKAQSTLPDVFKSQPGLVVDSKKTWFAQRRPEIIDLFTQEVYGKIPDTKLFSWTYESLEKETAVLDGQAYRQQVRMILKNAQGKKMPVDIMCYYPVSAKKKAVPFIVFLNYGNHTLSSDSTIQLSISSNYEIELERDAYGRRFPIADIIKGGCGVITACYDDFVHDSNSKFRSITQDFYQLDPDLSSAISIWAWGHSRLLDFALTQKIFDPKKAGVLGHSRLGKTALWTAVNDERFQYAFVNESGNNGVKLHHHFTTRAENIRQMNAVFPHWSCKNFKKYDGQDSLRTIPFDQHWIMACVAPRKLCLGDASEDLWADPEGSYLALLEAEKVYRFLGKKSQLPTQMPKVSEAWSTGYLGYHLRAGQHDLAPEDWLNYVHYLKSY